MGRLGPQVFLAGRDLEDAVQGEAVLALRLSTRLCAVPVVRVHVFFSIAPSAAPPRPPLHFQTSTGEAGAAQEELDTVVAESETSRLVYERYPLVLRYLIK